LLKKVVVGGFFMGESASAGPFDALFGGAGIPLFSWFCFSWHIIWWD